ncbi:exonuclease/endonuclease/phosphatase family protein [Actinokineospora spheciospongiae]|uniref:hypothetical protein n=1 Tax=Actinokineospora spheciospongiae TaxID=909613 RepID=UPI00190F0DD3|nr:hypothetical protein [Actinokineospora spheciospongiae]
MELLYRDLTTRHGLTDLYRHHHPDTVEHSWARRPELGYRYDHAHFTTTLLPHITDCRYDHSTREHHADGSRLTDHSALTVATTLTPTHPLLPSAPVNPAQHNEPTLF